MAVDEGKLYDALSEVVTYGPHRAKLDEAFADELASRAKDEAEAVAKAAAEAENPTPQVTDEEAFAAAVKAEVAKQLKSASAKEAK